MSGEVCKHGVEIQHFDVRGQAYRGTICVECAHDTERKECRAEWIRTNAACFFDGNDMEESVKLAEQMADILIARGYL